MLSGVGPASTLSKFSIPVIADIPAVGQNMHDTTNIGGPSGLNLYTLIYSTPERPRCHGRRRPKAPHQRLGAPFQPFR